MQPQLPPSSTLAPLLHCQPLRYSMLHFQPPSLLLLLLLLHAGAWHATANFHALCASCAQHHRSARGLCPLYACLRGQPPGEQKGLSLGFGTLNPRARMLRVTAEQESCCHITLQGSDAYTTALIRILQGRIQGCH